MNFIRILTGLVPFLAFGILVPVLGAPAAAGVGVLAALVIIAATARGGVQAVSVVQGIALLVMAVAALTGGAAVSSVVVRFGPAVAALLLGAFMLATATRHPFTAQAARRQVPSAFWHDPVFLQANHRISIAWGLAVVFLGACHLISTVVPSGLIHIVVMWGLPLAGFYLAVTATRRISAEAAAQQSKLAAPTTAAGTQEATAE